MALLNRISLHRTVYFTHICHFFFRQSTKTWTIPLLLILFLISFETRFTLIYLFQWKVVKRCHLSTSSKSTEAKPYNHSTIQPTIIDGGHWFIRLKLWVTCECIDFGHRHTSNRQFINEFVQNAFAFAFATFISVDGIALESGYLLKHDWFDACLEWRVNAIGD